MPIFITSSVFKLEKGYLYQNGVEFHQQFNGICGATWCNGGNTFLFYLHTIQQSSEIGGATRYLYGL